MEKALLSATKISNSLRVSIKEFPALWIPEGKNAESNILAKTGTGLLQYTRRIQYQMQKGLLEAIKESKCS